MAFEPTTTRVLLVEDNPLNADMLSRRLRRRGVTVVLAGTGLEAISVAHIEHPDLILMDIDLPDIDGWEATRRLKADARTKGIPIIALTAHAMVSDRDRSLAVGCDDFDTKPIEFARLLEKMARMLEKGRAA